MRIALMFTLVLAAASCKKAADAPQRASCETPTTKLCEDYEGDAAFLAGRKKDCTAGTWKPEACPTADVLGSCREQTKRWTRTRHYYVGAAADLTRAQAECGAYGTWLAPASPTPTP